MLKLISATPSPYARKVRIALAEKGLPFELMTEVPWDRTTSTPKYNPLEKLPVLILEDGSSVYESSFILQYLELKYPHPPLLPGDIDGTIAARRLEVLCDGICDAVVLSFFEQMRSAEGRSQHWMDRQRRKIEGGVREMARLVGDRAFAVGDAFGLGDIAVGTALGYLLVRFSEFDWRSLYPDLAAFSARIEARPSFANTVPVRQVISDKVV
ncbi:glutathione S-transferase N-terminal domain-containing protein [Bradyrhizobium sp. dw_411]|uniref:glutathione S-transferase family protein n=1 Tax=Bradyrhizobium sp. dw_411 TaxID=2720082 RepID=UPI001BCD2C32|nr:glutathione S-transferase N-terminal domain-containing protein [Bradyrhizobium sp. dw_411]